MPAKTKLIIKRTLCFALCISILIAAPIVITANLKKAENENKPESRFAYLTVWQIDTFEGGKSSRASFLQNTGNRFSESGGCYVNVKSLTSRAAFENIDNGILPDVISYGAGMSGLEGLLKGKTPYVEWAHGGYCLLAVDEKADFGDLSAANTVVNAGTENASGAAALFCGLQGAALGKPTSAYVDLINGKYKYLLGTQRDIFRLKTRGQSFKVKAVTEFNDLYQNISVIAGDPEKQYYGNKFVDFLLSRPEEITKIGLMCKTEGNKKLYDDEMAQMEGLDYTYKLISPVSETVKNQILSAVENSDLNLLKNLLK